MYCSNFFFRRTQICSGSISEEDVQQIIGEEDLTKRATMVISLAKRVLGHEYSMFVSPQDIVEGNPRLNLAFTASLFNSHPALGPSEEEIAAVHSTIESLTEKNKQLEVSLKQETTIRVETESKVDELIQTQNKMEKLSNELMIKNQEKEETIIVIQAEKEELRRQLTQEKDEAIAALRSQMEQQIEEIIRQKQMEISALQSRYEDEIAKLKENHQQQVTVLEVQKQEGVKEKEIQVETIQTKHNETITQAEKDHTEEVAKLKQKHEEEVKAVKVLLTTKVVQLKDVIQQLNGMLPDRDGKEGFLIKQGGGSKSWQKRYFTLKTNFVCYFKDPKNLKHPQGVIDLNDCKVSKVDFEEVKKKFVFQICTRSRIYLVKGEDDEDVESWMSAIEKAKAKYRSDANVRQTFLENTKSSLDLLKSAQEE